MFNLAANRDNVCKLRLTDDHIARKLSEIIPWELSSGMDGQIYINALPQSGYQLANSLPAQQVSYDCTCEIISHFSPTNLTDAMGSGLGNVDSFGKIL